MKANGPAYEPLAMSNSGSGEENLFSSSRRPVRRTRRLRSRRLPATEIENGTKIRKRARWAVAATVFGIIIVTWLIVLTWFALILRTEDYSLRSDVAAAVVGVQNVPLAVQACHTASASLRMEQATLSDHLQSLNTSLAAINAQLPQVLSKISSLESHQQKLPLTPLPRLSESVAALGAELRDLHASFNQLQDSQAHSNEAMKLLNASVVALNASIFTLSPTTPSTPTTAPPQNNTLLIALEDKMKQLNVSVSGRLKILDSDLRQTLTELDHQAEEKANLSTRLTNLDADVKQLQTQIPSAPVIPTVATDFEIKLQNLNKLVLDLKQNVSAVGSDYNQLLKELSILKSQFTELTKSNVTAN